ncbi:MAG TPA: mechanosensitive ion channel family protein [Candidatus Gracilibacteria bacterium]
MENQDLTEMTKQSIDLSKESFKILWDKFHLWFQEFVLFTPNAILAFLVFLLFIVAGKIISRITERGTVRLSRNVVIGGLVASMTRFIVIGIGLFFSLEILQLSKVVTSLLAGAGIVGLAMGIAFQDFVANIIAGIYLAIKKPLHVGHVVKTAGDQFGTVINMNLRSTIIETTQGQRVYIPNREVFQNPLINYSQKKIRRIDLPVGIQYTADLEMVKKVVLEVLENLSVREKSQPFEVFYTEFGDSSINFLARFWIQYTKETDYNSATDQAVMAIKKAFDKNHITIPFPIRTLDINPQQWKDTFK